VARVPLTFRQRDVTAAIKAVERAGHQVARVLIDREGRIIVELAPPVGSSAAPEPEFNEWDELYESNQANPVDEWLAKQARKTKRSQPG
jgi:hypothetical protein